MRVTRPQSGNTHGRRATIEQLVGLARSRNASASDAAAESSELAEEFRDWVEDISTVDPVYLHWGGSERKLIGDKAVAVDVYRSCFVPWLELKSSSRRQGSTNLESAMRQLLPHLPYVPHQAFEDALATLAVLVATADFGGKL